MTAYAVAHLEHVEMCPDIVEYLERIDGTLAPFDGRFIVHGARPEVREGQWPGTLVVIEFPDQTVAREWYESAAYQAILPLRLRHAKGPVILVEGVEMPHKATDVLV